MIDVPVAYDDIASTLPRDVVDAIQISAACLKSANRQHMWDVTFTEAVRNGRQGILCRPVEWHCVYCGVTTRTAPVPPVEKPWPPIPWDD